MRTAISLLDRTATNHRLRTTRPVRPPVALYSSSFGSSIPEDRTQIRLDTGAMPPVYHDHLPYRLLLNPFGRYRAPLAPTDHRERPQHCGLFRYRTFYAPLL
jgi:hypothetical protein